MAPPASKPRKIGLEGPVRPLPGQNARELARRIAKPWQILSGLIASGFLLALPGGLLPLWGYHIHPDFGTAANYFLSLGGGVAAGASLARRFARRTPLEKLLAGGCFAAALSLLLLAV